MSRSNKASSSFKETSMATAYQNLSEYDFNSVPDASEMNIGIVVAEWNKNITEKLLEGACNTLEKHGVKPENIVVKRVPGSFELTFGAKRLAETKELDAVIVLGAGVNGTTPSVALQTRIDAAERYLKAHPDIPAVLSGGQGPGEDISEARVMYDALTERGIDPARLILEEQSVNTRQNLKNSLPLLEKQGFDSYGGRLAVITNGFHMARVGLLWDLPTELVQVPAKLPWWLDANYYLRESFAIVNDMVLRPLLA